MEACVLVCVFLFVVSPTANFSRTRRRCRSVAACLVHGRAIALDPGPGPARTVPFGPGPGSRGDWRLAVYYYYYCDDMMHPIEYVCECVRCSSAFRASPQHRPY